MIRLGLRRSIVLVFCLLPWAGGCTREATTPNVSAVEVVAAGGAGQYGTAGQALPRPLRVVVREVGSLRPVEGVELQWMVVSGDAELEGPESLRTDAAGVSEAVLRLGTREGPITVVAELDERSTGEVRFTAFLVGELTLDSLGSEQVAPGESLELFGANFSPVPEQNIVRIGGLRARVLEASVSRVVARVPECLPTRPEIDTDIGLGLVQSSPLPVAVVNETSPREMVVGEFVDLDDPDGVTCIRLSGGAGARYLALVRAQSTIGAGLFPFTMSGVSSDFPATTAPREADVGFEQVSGFSSGAVPGPEGAQGSAQAALDRALRLEEARLIRERAAVEPTPGPAETLPGVSGPAPSAVPDAGSRRSFFVFNGSGQPEPSFEEVQATARYVGTQVVLYVDDDAPEPGFSDDDLKSFADRFDEIIHPTVSREFGEPSDLDDNGRVAVLFTPIVNQLTDRESASFVGGFFFGRDLLPDQEGSNGGEVFYALVPDPEAEFGDQRLVSSVMDAVPAVLAHELQHMVHFKERVLRLGAPAQDAIWVLEGLAQMAEEFVARAYETGGVSASDAELFRDGNRRRARVFLSRPDTVSLIFGSGGGTLAERGAGFLFMLYLERRERMEILRRLTQTVRTGTASVEAETGEPWDRVFSDWATAVFADGVEGVPSRFTFPELDLPGFLGHPSPLRVQMGGGTDFMLQSVLRSSSSRYFVLDPPDDGSLGVGFGGEAGGAQEVGAALSLRLLRLP